MGKAQHTNAIDRPAMPGAETDIVWDLIANCAAAWARFGRAVSLTDEDEAKKDGREITPADLAEYEAANEAEKEAYNALLAFSASKAAAVRAKAYFIQMRIDLGDRLQEDEVDLLLGFDDPNSRSEVRIMSRSEPSERHRQDARKSAKGRRRVMSRQEIEDEIERLIDMLDDFDGDPELEDGGDAEPSFGPGDYRNGRMEYELEADTGEDKPFLGWTEAQSLDGGQFTGTSPEGSDGDAGTRFTGHGIRAANAMLSARGLRTVRVPIGYGE